MIKIHVTDNSAEVLNELERKVRLALASMGDTIEGYAKEDCPVDTGLLRNSITYAVSGDGAAISSYKADNPKPSKQSSGTYSGNVPQAPREHLAVYIGTNVYYAIYVELIEYYRHLSGKAHFLRDAATGHGDELKNKTETILRA